MSIPFTGKVCEIVGVNAARPGWPAWLITLMVVGGGLEVSAQSTNNPPATNSQLPRVEAVAPQMDDSAFRIIAERNIFNANRSGGLVRAPSRRPGVVEFFTLVGTMAYQKGTFAFFQGSSSELTKVIKTNDVIAGQKLVAIDPNGVKLEADGKDVELPVGSQMRREDQGAWQVAEVGPGQGADASSSSGPVAETSGSGGQSIASASSSNSQSDILKRLMERRAKESQ